MKSILIPLIMFVSVSCEKKREIAETKQSLNDSIMLITKKVGNSQDFPGDTLDLEYIHTPYEFINDNEKTQTEQFLTEIMKKNKAEKNMVAQQKSTLVKNDNGMMSILVEQNREGNQVLLTHHYDIKAEKKLRISDIFFPKIRLEGLVEYIKSQNPDKNLDFMSNDFPFVFDDEGNFTIYISDNSAVQLSREEVAPFVNPKMKFRLNVPPRVDCSKEKCVALTFDDGPGAMTPKLLDILAESDAKATFFVLGHLAEKNINVLQRMQREGHQIENHSWNHKNLHQLGQKDIEYQINSTNDKLEEIIGERPTLFRPPYGNFNDFVKKQFGMPIILWSLDTEDWKNKNPNIIVEKISKARNGEIILLHDIHKASVEAMPKAIKILKDKGYHLVTLDELFYGRNIDNKVVYSRNYSL